MYSILNIRIYVAHRLPISSCDGRKRFVEDGTAVSAEPLAEGSSGRRRWQRGCTRRGLQWRGGGSPVASCRRRQRPQDLSVIVCTGAEGKKGVAHVVAAPHEAKHTVSCSDGAAGHRARAALPATA